jgi:chromosome segregation ATPase
MDNPLKEKFQGLAHFRKELKDHLSKLNNMIQSLLKEQRQLNAEIRLLNRKLSDLNIEKQRPISESGKYKLEVEIQDLKHKVESIENEAGYIDEVFNEYRNDQQAIWKEINEVWEKQCQIWDRINPSKISNADE